MSATLDLDVLYFGAVQPFLLCTLEEYCHCQERRTAAIGFDWFPDGEKEHVLTRLESWRTTKEDGCLR